jgi:UDP-sugar transporter A1/2/3
MKILTTAAFSVLLLRKKLLSSQWIALFLLAIGVGIVQIQSNAAGAQDSHPIKFHAMNQMAGLLAVAAACFTSGLAGVYFEMVLKNSQGDIWVRNIQLSLFSLLPALSPMVLAHVRSYGSGGTEGGSISTLFDNFGPWAWATVAIQVIGGLLTALVIKYSDNILKGFATSLSILISFLASIALFDFRLSFNFLTGSLLVVCATWLYNQRQVRGAGCRGNKGEIGLGHINWKDPEAVTLCCRSQDEIDSPTLSMTSEKAWEQDQKLHFFNAQTGAA